MLLEPVLLCASLRAVLRNIFDALGTCIERDELLAELSILLIFTVLLVFDYMLQWAFFVLALADVDQFVAWRPDIRIFFVFD